VSKYVTLRYNIEEETLAHLMNTKCEFSEQVHTVKPSEREANIWFYRDVNDGTKFQSLSL
jgi:hypothetical protein